jgi:hypothetical protein
MPRVAARTHAFLDGRLVGMLDPADYLPGGARGIG